MLAAKVVKIYFKSQKINVLSLARSLNLHIQRSISNKVKEVYLKEKQFSSIEKIKNESRKKKIKIQKTKNNTKYICIVLLSYINFSRKGCWRL